MDWLKIPSMSTVEFLSFIITLIGQPFLCFFGTLINLGCICALLPSFQNRYCRKTSLLIYLIALGICNSIQLTLSVFVIILPACEQFLDDELYPRVFAELRQFNAKTMFWVYPIIMSANYTSIGLLTLICAQRYQSICSVTSVWRRRLQFVRNCKRCVAIVVLFALFINFPRYWEPRFSEAYQKLYQSLFYKVIQEGIVYGLIVYGLPMCFLVWLNYNSIKVVWLNKSLPGQHLDNEHRTAHMTISLFVLFFITTTMSVVLKLLVIFLGDMFFSLETLWIVDLSNLLCNSSALCMPIVCFAFTRGFRDLFFLIHNQNRKSLSPVQL